RNTPQFNNEKIDLPQTALATTGKKAPKGAFSGSSDSNQDGKNKKTQEAGYGAGGNINAGDGGSFTLSANPDFLASIKRKHESNAGSFKSSLYSGIKSKPRGLSKSNGAKKRKEDLTEADLTESSYDSLLKELEDLLTENTAAARFKKAISEQLKKLRPPKPPAAGAGPQEDTDVMPDPGKIPPQFLRSLPRRLRPRTNINFTPEPPPALEEQQEEPQGPKIVSLVPNVTEILFALGVGDNVVGVSNLCNYPQKVSAIPKLGDYYGWDTGKILSLKPDVVFLYQGNDIKESIQSENIKVVEWSEPANLAQLTERINSIAGAIEADASSLNSSLARDFARVRVRNPKKIPRVFVDLGGYWPVKDNEFIGFLLNQAGGRSRFGKDDLVSSWDDIVKANPDVIISVRPQNMHEDYGKLPGINSVNAKKEEKICYATNDESDIISRPGPRSPRAVEILRRYISEGCAAALPR
ncbi:MAG: ABC transporter substrate-binding protein, partial [Elusimicrobiota bacterium]|nr:ABC transporter substrate-binding protein [Elusimicrobiota bacterium]